MRWLLVLLLCSCSAVSASQQVRVHDGDTFTLDGQRWRLWGVDAPELDQLCDGLPCGEYARERLSDLVTGQAIACEPRGRSYDRTVGVCSAGGVDLGAQMVLDGWALDYRRYSGGAYSEQESLARSKTKGVWGSRFIPPWDYRLTRGRGR